MAVAHKGAISFGMVHIPVQMYKTTQSTDISFNQLCKDTLERVHYKKYCANCKKELKTNDIVKGYQYEKDKYIIISDDEIEELKVEKDRTIHILHFARLDEIDDIYYEKNYYAIPEKYAEKAYALLCDAMHKLKVVAIAKTVIGTKETLLALCPQKEGLLVKTLFYEEEIIEIPKKITHPKIDKKEMKMAETLIETMSQKFDISLYQDSFQEKLKEVIEAKIAGNKTIQVDAPIASDTPLDLMEALKASIAATNKSKGKRSVKH